MDRQQKTNNKIWFAFICLLMLSTSCVSIDLPQRGSEKAKNYSIDDPDDPFEDLNSPDVDAAWKSEETSNIIAILTECSSQKEYFPSQSTQELLSVLSETEIESQTEEPCHQRKCLITIAKGKYEGLPAKMRTVVFVKNSCLYQITYLGRPKAFHKELPIALEFEQGLKVP